MRFYFLTSDTRLSPVQCTGLQGGGTEEGDRRLPSLRCSYVYSFFYFIIISQKGCDGEGFISFPPFFSPKVFAVVLYPGGPFGETHLFGSLALGVEEAQG